VVDYERLTSDEGIVDARREALVGARSSSLEYAVHGKFRAHEHGVAFPDTFWLTVRELKDLGCSKIDIRAAIDVFEEALAMASEEACDELSDDEESEGEEREEAAVPETGPEGSEVEPPHVAVESGMEEGGERED
jgi:hypothetical protein